MDFCFANKKKKKRLAFEKIQKQCRKRLLKHELAVCSLKGVSKEEKHLAASPLSEEVCISATTESPCKLLIQRDLALKKDGINHSKVKVTFAPELEQILNDKNFPSWDQIQERCCNKKPAVTFANDENIYDDFLLVGDIANGYKEEEEDEFFTDLKVHRSTKKYFKTCKINSIKINLPGKENKNRRWLIKTKNNQHQKRTNGLIQGEVQKRKQLDSKFLVFINRRQSKIYEFSKIVNLKHAVGKQEYIHIIAKIKPGVKIELKMKNSDKIGLLKKNIQTFTKLPYSSFSVIHGKKELDCSRTISSYNFANFSTVKLKMQSYSLDQPFFNFTSMVSIMIENFCAEMKLIGFINDLIVMEISNKNSVTLNLRHGIETRQVTYLKSMKLNIVAQHAQMIFKLPRLYGLLRWGCINLKNEKTLEEYAIRQDEYIDLNIPILGGGKTGLTKDCSNGDFNNSISRKNVSSSEQNYNNVNINKIVPNCPNLNPDKTDKIDKTSLRSSVHSSDNADNKDDGWKKSNSTSWKQLEEQVADTNHLQYMKERLNEQQKKKDGVGSVDFYDPNKSTLDIHISAYDNSIEAAIADKFNEQKRDLVNKINNELVNVSVIQDPFQFPRQQKDYEITGEEVMQFKASQQLFILNKNGGGKRKVSSAKDNGSSVSSSDEEEENVNRFNAVLSTEEESDGESSNEDSDMDKKQKRGDSDSSDEESDTNEKQKSGASDDDQMDVGSDVKSDATSDAEKSSDSDEDEEEEEDEEDEEEDQVELDDTKVVDFDYVKPKKTSNKVGIIAENAYELISYAAAKKLFENVVKKRKCYYGLIPMVFPPAGTIFAINLKEAKNKYKLKDLRTAASEMRTDGYRWQWKGNSYGKDRVVVRSYWWALDDKGHPTKGFQKHQFVYHNKYMILQYTGNELYASDGLKHGNSRYNNNAYRQTRKSSLMKMLKMGKTQLPHKVWDTWKKSNKNLSLVTDPRNKNQVRNQRKNAKRISRFSKDTLFNLSILGSELIYIINDTTYPFLTYLNLVEYNVCLHLAGAPLIEEMLNTMTSNDTVTEIFYDTGFNYGPYFLSTLSWKHPFFNKTVILAAYLHDRKARPGHRFFFDEIYRQFEPFFKKIKGRFLLVTDAEFNFLHCWIYLNHVHCYRHQRGNLEWRLKEIKSTEVIKCLKFLDEVQRQPTILECDKIVEKAVAEITSAEDRKCFLKSVDKVKKESYAGLLRSYGSTETTLLSNIAESVNSLIASKKERKSVEADELVCLLFYLTNDYHRNIIRGYYGEGEFSLLPAFGNKKLGTPKMLEEINLPWSPPRDGICQFLKNESQLPVDDSMKLSGPLILKGDRKKSAITTIIAQDIVASGDVLNPKENYYMVIDKMRKPHSVKVNRKNLDDYKYYCSCNPDRVCIHIKAVLIYLKLDPQQVPDFGEGDAVKDRRKRRPAVQGGPGHKKPRPIDKKDEKADKRKDDGDDDGNDDGKDVKIDEKEAEEKRNRTLASVLNDDEIGNIENLVQQNYFNEKMPPPRQIPETDYPEWWDACMPEVETVLFYKTVFIPTFDRPLNNLRIGKAVIFKSYKEFYVLLYRKSDNEMTAYVAADAIDPDSTKEIGFTAAQCCRDTNETTINVQGYYCDEKEITANPFFLLFVKLVCLCNKHKPEDYAFDFTEFDNEFTLEKMQALSKTKREVNSKLYEFSKIEKMELYCCCRRSYFKCSEERSNALKLQQTTQCDKCKQEFFDRCVNRREKSSSYWTCYTCSVAPVLPKWGGKNVTNTCPLDNLLSAMIIMNTEFPHFTEVIRNNKRCNNYENELIYFLDDCTKAANAKELTEKKEAFILRNYATNKKGKAN